MLVEVTVKSSWYNIGDILILDPEDDDPSAKTVLCVCKGESKPYNIAVGRFKKLNENDYPEYLL